eukprot:TRINITY_DN2275_c0_g1_i1.p1 TRINITY_DN2275_c0_g1~~TRINITY_DN2275_c0_g1_i1.p1  ORF type:complete len:303 (-),score=50.13 TRINITY_DN2275_c0_g1_i1:67-975(-)
MTLGTIVSMFEYPWRGTGLKIVESGDLDSHKHNALVIANHQETGDIPTLMAVVIGHKIQKVFWVMDSMFKYTQFGLVSGLHGDVFIQSGRQFRDKSLEVFQEGLLKICKRNGHWVILFPEGGLFWKLKESSRRYAEKNNLPIYERLALPRVNAFLKSVQTLRSHVKSIVDITIAYPVQEQPMTVVHVLSGSAPPEAKVPSSPKPFVKRSEDKKYTVGIHYRSFDINTIPTNEEELKVWLFDRWREKDALLNNFYATGAFESNKEERVLSIDWMELVGYQFIFTSLFVFFISSSTYIVSSLLF